MIWRLSPSSDHWAECLTALLGEAYERTAFAAEIPDEAEIDRRPAATQEGPLGAQRRIALIGPKDEAALVHIIRDPQRCR